MIPTVTDPMEVQLCPAVIEAAISVVPSSSAAMDAVREAMLQVHADPHFSSMMQHMSSATLLPLPSMVSLARVPISLRPLQLKQRQRRQLFPESKAIPVPATSANNTLSSASSHKLVYV